MDVYRTLRDTDIFSLGGGDDLVAREDPAWPARQQVQHAKLCGGKQHGLALCQDFMASWVQHQLVLMDHECVPAARAD